MTHSERSIFEQVTIESNDQSQDINLIAGVMGLEYYENIFSPNITAKMLILNTGDSIEGEDGKMQSVYNGLPLRGGERVAIKINLFMKKKMRPTTMEFIDLSPVLISLYITVARL